MGNAAKLFVGQEAKSGQYSYYVCGSLLKRGAGSCTGRYLSTKKFETQVIGCIREQISTVENLSKIVRMSNENIEILQSQSKDKISLIDTELMNVANKLDKLYQALESGLYTHEYIAPRIKALFEQKQQLIESKNELGKALTHHKIEKMDLDQIDLPPENS